MMLYLLMHIYYRQILCVLFISLLFPVNIDLSSTVHTWHFLSRCREVAWTEQDDEVLISLFQDSSNSGVDHPRKLVHDMMHDCTECFALEKDG